MKSFRETMNGSLALNSTRLARFWTAFVTSFNVRSATMDGVSIVTGKGGFEIHVITTMLSLLGEEMSSTQCCVS